jgi:hypothetical protein
MLCIDNSNKNLLFNQSNKAEKKQYARWLTRHIVNRTDAYIVENKWHAEDRQGKKLPLTAQVICDHVVGKKPVAYHAVGALGTEQANKCKWVCIEIDNHKDSPEQAATNTAFCRSLYDRLVSMGFRPLWEDSNGAGGYHLWILFDEPITADLAYRFGRWLVCEPRDEDKLAWQAWFDRQPEVFPKQRQVTEQHPYGNGCRAPGKHHRRDHWSRIWNGEVWLEWPEAIDFIVTIQGDPANLIPPEVSQYLCLVVEKEVPPAELWDDYEPGDRWERNYSGDLRSLDIEALFESKGLEAYQIGETTHRVSCRWHAVHTTPGDTCEIEINESGYPMFYCPHDHCQGKGMEHVCSYFGKEAVDRNCRERCWTDEFYYLLCARLLVDCAECFTPRRLLRYSEYLRIASNQQNKWIVKDLLEAGTLNIFTGLPFAGKTTVVTQMISDVLNRRPFLGYQVISACPIVYINADRLRERVICKRIERAIASEDERAAIEDNLLMLDVKAMPDVITPAYIKTLLDETYRILSSIDGNGTTIVIIDALRSAFLANQDSGAENDPTTMNKILRPFRALAGDTNSILIVPTHSNKSKEQYAGAASILGNCEGYWNIKRDYESLQSTLEIMTRDGVQPPLVLRETPTGVARYADAAMAKEASSDDQHLLNVIERWLHLPYADQRPNKKNIRTCLKWGVDRCNAAFDALLSRDPCPVVIRTYKMNGGEATDYLPAR